MGIIIIDREAYDRMQAVQAGARAVIERLYQQIPCKSFDIRMAIRTLDVNPSFL